MYRDSYFLGTKTSNNGGFFLIVRVMGSVGVWTTKIKTAIWAFLIFNMRHGGLSNTKGG